MQVLLAIGKAIKFPQSHFTHHPRQKYVSGHTYKLVKTIDLGLPFLFILNKLVP